MVLKGEHMFQFGPRRSIFINIAEEIDKHAPVLQSEEVEQFESFDLIYRTLCATLYNFVPMSGHPGGSISSGRFVAALLFETMSYDMTDPDRKDADIISYAAGHKALGLYAMWALRNEVVRIGSPQLLPSEIKMQLRLEDLLGFRRNPVTKTPLFKKYNSKALDGHPTPATPFVRLATGASGVGVGTSLGLALAARDYYGENTPMVHMVEGEGGMTPGRVYEAFAAAGTSSLKNAVIHIDWNQASIDSNAVCRVGDKPGDYVQWDPAEFAYLHDWNVILVPDGTDFRQIVAAQRRIALIQNSQPTAVVYRTVKGWHYGIEGKKSHGAGHTLCSQGFYTAVKPLLDETNLSYPECKDENQRCHGGKNVQVVEECFWNALTVIRSALETKKNITDSFARKISDAKKRLDEKQRMPRPYAPSVQAIYEIAENNMGTIPSELVLKAGQSTTLRGEFGRVMSYYNKASLGAMFVSSADLLGSTSVNLIGNDFPQGYFNVEANPFSRILSLGGICEDAQSAIMAGLTAFGCHIGVCSSYGAFIAALGHISARLHAIGCEAKKNVSGEPFKPFFLVCAHAGIKTGEDGPTHADPQPLQLLQENFPKGTVITLTPWDPQELWVLVSAALAKRPAVICPFVTRPNETVPDRAALRLAPVQDAAKGIYLLHRARKKSRGCVVLQGSEVAIEFAAKTLPLLYKKGIDIDAYYIASAELFDLLPGKEKRKIFSEDRANVAMGITGFTLPTLYRWVKSDYGREMSLYPFKKGHFLGSGKAEMVMKEAGLDGKSQCNQIVKYLKK
jgi:transketolase